MRRLLLLSMLFVCFSIEKSVAQCTPPNTSAISGSSTVCPFAGSNYYLYSVTNTTGSSYSWAVSGGSIASGNGTNSITVNWSSPWGSPSFSGSVTVVETTSGGCAGAAVSTSVTVFALPTVSSPVSSICVGGNTSLTPNSGGTWSSSNPSVITVTNAGIATGMAPGSSTLRFTSSSTGCSSSIILSVVAPSTSPIVGSNKVCFNSTGLNYSVTNTPGSSYVWTISGGGVQVSGGNANSITVNWGAAGSGNVRAVETNSAGCVGAPVNLPITIYGAPTTSPILGGTACHFIGSYVSYGVTGSVGSTYVWTATGGTPYTAASCGGWGGGSGTCYTNVSGISTTSSTVWVAWTGSGPGTLSVVETNAGGCVGPTLSLPVTIISPAVSASASQLCIGGAITLNPSAGGTWISNNTSVATVTNSGIVTGQTVGSASFTFTDNSTSCSAITPTVSVVKPVTSGITGNATVCANSNRVTYSVTNTPGSTYAWIITGGTPTIAGLNISAIQVNWGTAGTGNVSVVETNSLGCAGSPVNLPVTINALPITSLISGNTSPYANAQNLNYVVSSTALSNSYAWSVTGGTLSCPSCPYNNNLVTWGSTAGPGNVTVTETNVYGCVGAPLIVPITIKAIPLTSQISGTTTVCPYTQGVTYNVTNNSGSTYVWTIGGGGYQASGGNSNSIIVNWGAAGPGSVSVVESNTAGYTGAPVTLPVTISMPATSAITGSATVCSNATGVTYSVTNTPGSTYSWSINQGGTQMSGGNSNSISVNWDPTYSNGLGTFNSGISVMETNTYGCVGSQVYLPITVNGFNSFGVSGTQVGSYNNSCAGFTGAKFYAQGNVTSDPSTYTWTVNGGTVTSGAGTKSITVNWLGAGSGNVSFIETNPAGCVSPPHSQPITINPTPVTSAISQIGVACSNMYSYSNYYSVTNTPGDVYYWTATGGTTLSNQYSNSTMVNWGASGTGSMTVVEVNQASCAGAPVTLPVTINPTPITSPITGSTNTCEGTVGNVYSVTNNPGNTYSWSTNNGGYVTIEPTGSTTNRVLVDFIFPWAYSYSTDLSVTETSAAGCRSTPVSLTINSTYPNTSSITGISTVCPNTNGVAYSVNNTSGSSYTWTITGGSKASGGTSNSITVNWGAAGPGSVQVVETSSNGCSGGTMVLSVTISSPSTGAITGSANVCANSSGVAYNVPNTTGSTYVWTISGGGTKVSGGTTNAITVNWSSIGTGNVKVVETNSFGCQGAPVNFAVNIKYPSTSPISGSPSVCANTNGVAYSVTNTTGSNYAWTITGGGSVASGAGTSNITVNWTAAGAGNVKVVETSSIGCVGTSVNLPVTINALPTTSPITGNATACVNSNGVAYSVGNTVGSTYAWTITGGGSVATGNGTSNITANWGAAGSGNVKVIETNAAGCVGAAVNLAVTIKANPTTSAITGSATACPNATGIAYSVTNSLGSTYNWSITGGTKATGGTTNAITVNWGPGGPGNVSVVETNLAGCVGATISKAVTVSPFTSAIAGSVNVCPNSNGVAYSVANVTGNNYTWTATGGTVVCGQNTSTILVNWGVAGPGTLNVTERSATCTGVAVNLPVTITSTPATSAITGNAAVCSNATGAAYSVTNSSGSTYAWTVSGGTLMSGNGTYNILVNWNSSGTGNVSVVETSSNGCVGIAVNKMVAIGSPTTSGITGNTNLCVPSNGIAYSVTNTPGSSYVWAVNGGTQFSGGTTNSIAVNWGLSGSGSVRVTETNSAGCVGATVSQVVTVNPTPATSAITGNNSVCPNATGVSYSVTNTPGSTYVWMISGGTPAASSTTNSITVNWGAIGTGNVSVVETNNFGCVGIAVNLPVTINALPTITVNPASATISYGGSVSLTASGASTYIWSPSTGLNTTTGATVTASPSASTTYTVTGTDSRGCVNTKTVPVSLTCTPPSVFISASNGLNLCKVSSTTLTATAISGATYTWTSSYGDYSKTGTTTNGGNTLLVYDEETYTVTVNVSGCIGSASTTTYRTGTLCNAIARVAPGSQPAPVENDDSPKGHKISVHPNPANHEVIVETPWRAEQDTQVVLYDMMGRVSGSGILKKGEWTVTISTSEVANGMYVVRIGTGDQANAEKVIIEHK